MILHQIFIDIGKGKTFRQNDLYSKIYDINSKLYEIKVWNEEDLDNLIKKYPEFVEMYNSFPNRFYKIDFMRPLILHSEGGFYMDMDNELIGRGQVIDGVYNNQAYNDVMFFKDRNVYLEYVRFMKDRYTICKMPTCWTTRRFMYSVGQRCYDKFCKKKGIDRDLNISFIGYDTQFWLRHFRPNSVIKPFDRKTIR